MTSVVSAGGYEDESEPAATSTSGDASASDAEGESQNEKRLFSGRVVFVRDALARRDITAFEEFKEQVALETLDGKLLPIIPDWRGRAFFQDERLRDRRVDLIGTQRDKLPYLQVLVVYFVDDEGNREYMDYWCDICSIPMYEIKACDCCQGDIRLRLQPRELPDYIMKQPGTSKSSTTEPSPESTD